MLELYQLRYFLAVVETGSFTKAAKRVRVSQPTLSGGVQKLEAALGAELFERSSRRVFLTRAGTRFVDRARTIVAEVQRAQADLAETPTKHVLHLGVLVTLAAGVLRGLVRDFLRTHPELTLELFEGTEREVKNRLEAGQLDLALTIERPDLPGRLARLYEEGYSLAIAAGHALAQKPQVHVRELADQPTIVRTRCELLSETSRFFTRHNVRPQLVYRTEHDERALAMVGAGLGITVMPDHYRAPDVTRLPLSGFAPTRQIALVGPPRDRSKRTSAAQRFSEYAQSQAWPSRVQSWCL